MKRKYIKKLGNSFVEIKKTPFGKEVVIRTKHGDKIHFNYRTLKLAFEDAIKFKEEEE